MKTIAHLRHLLSSLLCILTLAFATRAFASDPIPGVDVHLKNTSTGQVTTVATNPDGSFDFSNLTGGTYTLWVSQAQCAKAINTKGTGAVVRQATPPSDLQFGMDCDDGNDVTIALADMNHDGAPDLTVSSPGSPTSAQVGSDVRTPRDQSTGQSTGKRMHKPFVITKEWSASSPGLFVTVAAGRSHELSGHVTLMK